jgi:hypothetical protein
MTVTASDRRFLVHGARVSTSLLLLRPSPRSQRLRRPLLHSSQQRRELVPAWRSPGRHGAGGGVVREIGERERAVGERGLRVALMISKGHIAKEANVPRSHPDLIVKIIYVLTFLHKRLSQVCFSLYVSKHSLVYRYIRI